MLDAKRLEDWDKVSWLISAMKNTFRGKGQPPIMPEDCTMYVRPTTNAESWQALEDAING